MRYPIYLSKIKAFFFPNFSDSCLCIRLHSACTPSSPFCKGCVAGKKDYFCETFGDKERKFSLHLFEGILAVPAPYAVFQGGSEVIAQTILTFLFLKIGLPIALSLSPQKARSSRHCQLPLGALAVHTQPSTSRNPCSFPTLESLALDFAISPLSLQWDVAVCVAKRNSP